jgi:hypothetical protein
VSAREILEKVKAMPASEREKLFLAFLDLQQEAPPTPARKGKSVKWPDVEMRAKRIFGRRVFPNLVLLEREEEAF